MCLGFLLFLRHVEREYPFSPFLMVDTVYNGFRSDRQSKYIRAPPSATMLSEHPTPPDEPKHGGRRRTRKRKGPPQLNFVTATDPADFRGEQAKRSVRSQAMIQHRYWSAEQKRQKSEGMIREPTRTATAERVVPIQQAENAAHLFVPQPCVGLPLQAYFRPPEDPWNAHGHDAVADAPRGTRSTAMAPAYRPGDVTALEIVPMRAAATSAITAKEARETLLRRFVAISLVPFCIGNNTDPFMVIPKFASPELNSNLLLRSCNGVFANKQNLAQWVPSMLAHPHILLSSFMMVST